MGVVPKSFKGGIATDLLFRSDGTTPYSVGVETVSIKTVSNANYTVLTTDYFIKMNTATTNKTVTLFTAVGWVGKVIVFKNSGVKDMVITPQAGQLIDDKTNYHLKKTNAISCISDGVGWLIY